MIDTAKIVAALALIEKYDQAAVTVGRTSFNDLELQVLRKHLPEATIERLRVLCVEYAAVPKPQRENLMPAEEAVMYAGLKELSDGLRMFLKRMPIGMFLALDDELFRLTAEEGRWKQHERIGSWVDPGGATHDQLCDWSAAAERLGARSESQRGSGGARKTTPFASGLVTHIAYQVRSDRIKPSASDGSKFMQICRPCFSLAGFASGPERAVQRYIEDAKMRREYSTEYDEYAYWGDGD